MDALAWLLVVALVSGMILQWALQRAISKIKGALAEILPVKELGRSSSCIKEFGSSSGRARLAKGDTTGISRSAYKLECAFIKLGGLFGFVCSPMC